MPAEAQCEEVAQRKGIIAPTIPEAALLDMSASAIQLHQETPEVIADVGEMGLAQPGGLSAAARQAMRPLDLAQITEFQRRFRPFVNSAEDVADQAAMPMPSPRAKLVEQPIGRRELTLHGFGQQADHGAGARLVTQIDHGGVHREPRRFSDGSG